MVTAALTALFEQGRDTAGPCRPIHRFQSMPHADPRLVLTVAVRVLELSSRAYAEASGATMAKMVHYWSSAADMNDAGSLKFPMFNVHDVVHTLTLAGAHKQRRVLQDSIRALTPRRVSAKMWELQAFRVCHCLALFNIWTSVDNLSASQTARYNEGVIDFVLDIYAEDVTPAYLTQRARKLGRATIATASVTPLEDILVQLREMDDAGPAPSFIGEDPSDDEIKEAIENPAGEEESTGCRVSFRGTPEVSIISRCESDSEGDAGERAVVPEAVESLAQRRGRRKPKPTAKCTAASSSRQ
jgi:hypothetical protein